MTFSDFLIFFVPKDNAKNDFSLAFILMCDRFGVLVEAVASPRQRKVEEHCLTEYGQAVAQISYNRRCLAKTTELSRAPSRTKISSSSSEIHLPMARTRGPIVDTRVGTDAASVGRNYLELCRQLSVKSRSLPTLPPSEGITWN
ncbi:MAG: hypothetical protein WCH39_10765 [Schlesneria sp.]